MAIFGNKLVFCRRRAASNVLVVYSLPLFQWGKPNHPRLLHVHEPQKPTPNRLHIYVDPS